MIPVCREIRKNILDISKKSGHGHIPTCFSIVEALYAVYDFMNHEPDNPQWEDRDIFILSKGHGALAYYCVLSSFGYFDSRRVDSFGAFMSDFGCHADRLKVPGVEVSTGSLGHGIGVAAGVALAFKIKNSTRKVYTIIGDGESNEGTVWEAVLVAVSLQLDNLCIIYDNNMSHGRGLQIHSPVAHFKGFGCDVLEVNGHDVDEIKQALKKGNTAVKVIIANTEKGHGCRSLVDNQYEWHRRSPNDSELETLKRELNEKTI